MHHFVLLPQEHRAKHWCEPSLFTAEAIPVTHPTNNFPSIPAMNRQYALSSCIVGPRLMLEIRFNGLTHNATVPAQSGMPSCSPSGLAGQSTQRSTRERS